MTTKDDAKWPDSMQQLPDYLKDVSPTNGFAAHAREAKEDALRALLTQKQGLEALSGPERDSAQESIEQLDIQIAELSFQVMTYDNDYE